MKMGLIGYLSWKKLTILSNKCLKTKPQKVGRIYPKKYLTFTNLHVLPHFYPNIPIFLHRYICHICDISQLWPGQTRIPMGTLKYFYVLWGTLIYCQVLWGTVMYFDVLWGTLRFFWVPFDVLWGTLRYCEVLTGTSSYFGCFQVIWATIRYFAVLLGTLR